VTKVEPDMKAAVDRAGCFGCGACTTVCTFGAITIEMYKAVVNPEKCTGCGLCAEKCAAKVMSMQACGDVVSQESPRGMSEHLKERGGMQ